MHGVHTVTLLCICEVVFTLQFIHIYDLCVQYVRKMPSKVQPLRWRTKLGSIELLASMTSLVEKQLAACLPQASDDMGFSMVSGYPTRPDIVERATAD